MAIIKPYCPISFMKLLPLSMVASTMGVREGRFLTWHFPVEVRAAPAARVVHNQKVKESCAAALWFQSELAMPTRVRCTTLKGEPPHRW